MVKRAVQRIFLLILVGCAVCLALGYGKLYERSQTYQKKTLTGLESQDQFIGLDFKISEDLVRDSGWKIRLKVPGSKPYDYYGVVTDFCVKNLGDSAIDNWELRLNVQTEMYLNQEWNGTITLMRDGKAYEGGNMRPSYVADETKEMLKNAFPGTLTTGSNFLVALKPGDTIIYHPNNSDTPEIPINNKGDEIHSGFIFYCPMSLNPEQKQISYADYEDWNKYVPTLPAFNALLTYYPRYSITKDPLYSLLISLSIVWIVAATAMIAYSLALHRNRSRTKQDDTIIRQSISVFTEFIDAKDFYTRGHSSRVSTYSAEIARRLGMSEDEVRKVAYIALMHDCGKVFIPDEILKKAGKLTKEEFEEIKQHTVRGAQMLKNFSSVPDIANGARYHHERYDGTGYPEGLKGTQIPLIGRIICVADCFDAMSSDRCYRKACDMDYIISEYQTKAGTQFDPKLAEIMLDMIKEGYVNKVMPNRQ